MTWRRDMKMWALEKAKKALVFCLTKCHIPSLQFGWLKILVFFTVVADRIETVSLKIIIIRRKTSYKQRE